MARRKELRYLTIGLQDGTGGTGAINEATPAVADTEWNIDTLAMTDTVTIVPVGARFTTAGIATVRSVTAENHSQQWTITIDATGGTFDIVLNSETAATIAYNATGATVQTALEGLASITAGDVTVTGIAGGPFTVTMAGTTFGNVATSTLTTVATSLTGGAGTAVVAVVQTGLVTWNITFTPAVATGSVPVDDAVITWLPQRVEMKVGEGNIEHTENSEPIIDTDRGLLDGVRAGTEQPMEVSTSFVYDWLRASSGGAITVYEALNQLGDASDWITSSTDPCEVYQVDIFVIDRPPCGSEQAEMIFFRNFNKQSVSASVEAASVTLSGICNATAPQVYRVANTDDAVGSQN